MAFLTVHIPDSQPYDYQIEANEIIIGRLPGVDLILDDRSVSRQHLRIYREGGDWAVEDMNSSHGSTINKAKLSVATLHDGDELRVGKCRIYFRRGRIKESYEGYPMPSGLTLANAKPHRLDIMNAIIDLLTPLPGPDMLREKAMSFLAVELKPERIVWAEVNDDMQLEAIAAHDRDGPADASWYGHEEEMANKAVEAGRVQRLSKPPTLCIPLMEKDSVIGTVYLDVPGRKIPFSDSETWFCIMSCRLFGSMLAASREKARTLRENRGYSRVLRTGVLLAGKSREMEVLRQEIIEASESSQPLLITGPNGSGREEVARAVHAFSMRDTFVSLNCGYMPIGSGVRAFYGNDEVEQADDPIKRISFLEAAGGGTLFLNDVHRFDRGAQSALVKTMTERAPSIGYSADYKPMSTFIIASTDQNLEELVEKGKFRQDLYDRLSSRIITVPPLSERLGDLDFPIRNASGGRVRKLSGRLKKCLSDYEFEENIEELNSMVHQAMLMVPEDAEEFEIELAIEDIAVGRVEKIAPLLQIPSTERQYILEVLTNLGWDTEKAAKTIKEKRKQFKTRAAAFQNSKPSERDVKNIPKSAEEENKNE